MKATCLRYKKYDAQTSFGRRLSCASSLGIILSVGITVVMSSVSALSRIISSGLSLIEEILNIRVCSCDST